MIEINSVLKGGVDFDEARINKNQLTEVIETWRRNRLTEAFKVEGGVITQERLKRPRRARSGRIRWLSSWRWLKEAKKREISKSAG